MSEIIEKLKELRQEHQLTALEISIGCQTTERSVWRWLHGGNSPSPQAVSEIEKFIKEVRAKAGADEKREIERCEIMILNEIYNGDNLLFHARPKAGERYSEATYPVGLAQRDVSLKSLSSACGLRLTDPIVLKVLDHLSLEGKIRIISFFVPIRKNFEHLNFKIEVGEARRDIPGQDQSFEIVKSYRDKPISKEEIKKSGGILNIKEQIEAIYKRHEDSLRARYGASGLEKEIELHHEKVEDEARARISQLEASEALSKINKGAKQMKGDHRPASEYDTVTFKEKKREFYEEKIKNDSQVTQIYYDCNSDKVVIEPGETKIILKMRMLEPIPVEKSK